jgi:hypothetical protein
MPKFTASLNLPKYASAPSSPTDGDVYYNTTDHKVYSRINGAWVDLGATAQAGSGIPDTIIDAKGDLIVGSSADSPIRFAVGSNGQILSANSTLTGGLEWIDNVADETRLLVKNMTGSTLTKGQVVYINGANGNLPTVALSKADTEATSSKTIGLVRQTITNNESGYLTLSGLLKGVDTTGLTAGQAVWLSASTAGAVTGTRPTVPDHAVLVGFVPKVDSNGEIFVYIQNGFELQELHNVLITDATSGQYLKYDGSKWVNAAVEADITEVVAGAGLTGGAASGSATINVGAGTGITVNADDIAVKLTDSTSTTDSTTAASATAVKAAYDRGSQGITDAASALSAANSKVASVTAGSSRVTIGGTATAPTVDVAAATTGVAGITQLTDSTSSTSTTTAATPNSVKSAYDLADTANTTAGAAIPKSTVTAKGDLIVATASGTVTALPAGTNNYVLTADSAQASGIKWAASAAGGGAEVYYQTTQPESANVGDIWVDSDDNTQPVTFDVEVYPTFLLMGA